MRLLRCEPLADSYFHLGYEVQNDTVLDDAGEPAPVAKQVMSGSSDPMAIPIEPFERQFLDFGAACRERRQPLLSGEEGLKALEIVLGVYESCRSGRPVRLGA